MSDPPLRTFETAPSRPMTNRTATRPWRFGLLREAVLVAETEATEVLAHDALDDLRREATVDLRRAHADLAERLVWCEPPRRPWPEPKP